jgi:hypothetical protein
LLAIAGVAAYLTVGGTNDTKTASVLPTKVVDAQAVGIVSSGPAATAGVNPDPGTLLASHSDLIFAVKGPAGALWTSDEMAGGTYILIYLPNGLCLASQASAHPQALALERCDLQASQRWLRQQPSVGLSGLVYWQLRNLASGRCIAAGHAVAGGETAAGLEPCEAFPGSSQQLAFLASS